MTVEKSGAEGYATVTVVLDNNAWYTEERINKIKNILEKEGEVKFPPPVVLDYGSVIGTKIQKPKKITDIQDSDLTKSGGPIAKAVEHAETQFQKYMRESGRSVIGSGRGEEMHRITNGTIEIYLFETNEDAIRFSKILEGYEIKCDTDFRRGIPNPPARVEK